MSNEFANAVTERVRALVPRLRMRLPSLAGGRAGGGIGRRFDFAAMLIDIADAVETGGGLLWRASRRAVLGLSGGLLWRGLAALTGVGLTATLVTALSSGPQDGDLPQLSSLTVAEAMAAPAVRDVRVQAVPVALGSEGWVNVPRPIAVFGLESPELVRRNGYEARRSADGSRREDVLSFGEFGDAKPFLALKVSVNRDGDADRAGAAPSQPFVITLVRDAATRGLSVGRSGTVTAIETKFGAVETADIGLSDGSSGRSCIAFRHQDGVALLSFAGWWCGGEAKHADRAQLVCMIDRVDLLSAGDDAELRALFGKVELNRKAGCSQPRLSATGRKASWLDADAKAPPLKTSAARHATPSR